MRAEFVVPVVLVEDAAALREFVGNAAAARGWKVVPGAPISTRVLTTHGRFLDDTADLSAYAEVEVLGA